MGCVNGIIQLHTLPQPKPPPRSVGWFWVGVSWDRYRPSLHSQPPPACTRSFPPPPPHSDINLVARQALAMDRSQLIAVRAMMGAYCERPNVTAKVSVCANSLNFTLEKLR